MLIFGKTCFSQQVQLDRLAILRSQSQKPRVTRPHNAQARLADQQMFSNSVLAMHYCYCYCYYYYYYYYYF